jgi:hypothetical protein
MISDETHSIVSQKRTIRVDNYIRVFESPSKCTYDDDDDGPCVLCVGMFYILSYIHVYYVNILSYIYYVNILSYI